MYEYAIENIRCLDLKGPYYTEQLIALTRN